MKLSIFAGFIYVMYVTATPAFAASEAGVLDKDKRVIGAMIDDYATIAGRWYLEKKCHFLAADLLKEFESDISNNTVGMHTVLGVEESELDRMQKAGKDTANDPKWKCDKQGRDIVVTSVSKARKLNANIEKLR